MMDALRSSPSRMILTVVTLIYASNEIAAAAIRPNYHSNHPAFIHSLEVSRGTPSSSSRNTFSAQSSLGTQQIDSRLCFVIPYQQRNENRYNGSGQISFTSLHASSSSSTDESSPSPPPSQDDETTPTPDNTCSPRSSVVEIEDLDPSCMRVSEIKTELQSRNVAFDDCFDKESLCVRLTEARAGTVTEIVENTTTKTCNPKSSVEVGTDQCRPKTEESDQCRPKTEESDQCLPEPSSYSSSSSAPSSTPNTTTTTKKPFSREENLAYLRPLRVRELRTLCSSAGIRWGDIVEKEELVQRLLHFRESAHNFSNTGTLLPGMVTDIADDVLRAEIGGAEDGGASMTPLLVDVYATWCGPCQAMAPELEETAKTLGGRVRVVKMDSDKYQMEAARLNVEGLPSLILFEGGGTGRELKRVEGGMRSGALVNLVEGYL